MSLYTGRLRPAKGEIRLTEEEIRTGGSGMEPENAPPEEEKTVSAPETDADDTAETVTADTEAERTEPGHPEQTAGPEALESGTPAGSAREGLFGEAPAHPLAGIREERPEVPRPASGIPAVGCYGLTKRFGETEALSELSVELPAGKIIGLLGPNGSGKTTFIKILAGLLTPTAGEARICGEVPGVSTKAMVSYLPERMYFDPGMRVRECVGLFRDFYKDFDESRAVGMLSALSVPMDRKLKTLSKGTKEKVQLVLVMSRRAKLYLLDEPIGGVDPAARDYILSTIVAAHDPGATVLISTHLIRDVEPVLDGFLFLGGGRCVMSGEAEAVRCESGKTLDELFREVFRCF